MFSSILVALGLTGMILVMRKAPDSAFVTWAVVLLLVNLIVAETEKRRGSVPSEDSSPR